MKREAASGSDAAGAAEPEPMAVDDGGDGRSGEYKTPEDEVTALVGHTSEVRLRPRSGG